MLQSSQHYPGLAVLTCAQDTLEAGQCALRLQCTCMSRQRSLCEAASSVRLASRSALSTAAASSASRCSSSVWSCAPALAGSLKARGPHRRMQDCAAMAILSSCIGKSSALTSSDCRPGLAGCDMTTAVSLRGLVRTHALHGCGSRGSLFGCRRVSAGPAPCLQASRRPRWRSARRAALRRRPRVRWMPDAPGGRCNKQAPCFSLACLLGLMAKGPLFLLSLKHAEHEPRFSSRDTWENSRQIALCSFSSQGMLDG